MTYFWWKCSKGLLPRFERNKQCCSSDSHKKNCRPVGPLSPCYKRHRFIPAQSTWTETICRQCSSGSKNERLFPGQPNQKCIDASIPCQFFARSVLCYSQYEHIADRHLDVWYKRVWDLSLQHQSKEESKVNKRCFALPWLPFASSAWDPQSKDRSESTEDYILLPS